MTIHDKRSRAPRRLRIVVAVVAILFVPLAAIGVYGYHVLDAIGEAQGVAVVPLPTRAPRTDTEVHQVGVLTPSPTPSTGTNPAAPPAALPTGPVDDGTAGPAGVAAATGQDASPTPTPASPTGPQVAAEDTSGQAVIIAGAISASAADEDHETSAFDVLRELTIAGADRGDPADDAVWGGKDAVTILVLGVDRRADGGDQNADVIIIARLDLEAKTVRAVGLPRDLLVEIPGYGPGKINGAYDLGVRADPGDPVAGVALVRDTVEDNFGVKIDHYVLVDFAGFKRVIDAVGGVDVTVPAPIRDDGYPTDDYGTEVVVFEPGPQHMDGDRALKYARTRNADSDDQRRERQFQILMALFDEGKQLGTLTRAADLMLALGGAVQTSFPLEAQISLARIGLAMDRADILLAGVGQPLVEEGWTADGAWVYVGDPAAIAAFVQEGLGLAAGEASGVRR